MPEHETETNERPGYRIRYLWCAYGPRLAVCWREVLHGDQPPRYDSAATIHYGPLTSDTLATSLRRITPPAPGAGACVVRATDPQWTHVEVKPLTVPGAVIGSEFSVPEAPGHLELVTRWEEHKASRPTIEVDASPRRPDETADQFYRRIADAYRALAVSTGRPTTEIARLAGSTKGSVSNWVRQARQRGYLAPTSKGRTLL